MARRAQRGAGVCARRRRNCAYQQRLAHALLDVQASPDARSGARGAAGALWRTHADAGSGQ
ncbi:hypothetical protein FRC96_17215 [Lujinxingia vulgaris]|uniref:Uncharacterized protein n=1 Tax=Lujinxingia vulgaris TaxID=2600176 RepID=A0A5C6X1D5_9DELT|nr:hypothetical protein FRC96_17215 [Lujinxingia vulgaris]